MTGNLQPLDQQFVIVDNQGRPTEYFIRWAQQRQIDIGDSITLTDLEAFLTAHKLVAGNGVGIAPDGDLNNSPTITAKVQEILDQISVVRGVVLYRGAAGWAALAPGVAGLFLQTAGAGADPAWAAASGGGGLKRLHPHSLDPGTDGTSFGAGFMALLPYLVPQDCTITKIQFFARAVSATTKIEPIIYSANPATGRPQNLLAGGPQVTGVAFGVNDLPLAASLVLTAGTFVWFGVGAQVANWLPSKTYGMGGVTIAFVSPAPAVASTVYAGGPGDANGFYSFWLVA